MNVVTLWNRESTNFRANKFVDKHGTDTVVVESERDALSIMSRAIHSLKIDKATFMGPRGYLTWKKHQPDEDDACIDEPDDYYDQCDIDGECDCSGCPCDDDD